MVGALAFAFVAAAAVDAGLPAYRPRAIEIPKQPVQVVGYNDMRDMLEPMRVKFESLYPGLHINFDLSGTRFAPAALAEGRSAFAPMSAEFTPAQLLDYREKVGANPVAIAIAHASLDPKALLGPPAVFVHRDNPVSSIGMDRLARVFAGGTHTWGELGAQGAFAAKPVHAYGLKADTALAYFFQDRVLHGALYGERFTGLPLSADVVKKVAEDPLAIGFAAAVRETHGVKALAVGDPPVELNEETIRTGRYPLDRHLLIYVRPPIAPYVREFVRFALSREGQEAVAASPQHYIPLSASEAAAELEKLAK